MRGTSCCCMTKLVCDVAPTRAKTPSSTLIGTVLSGDDAGAERKAGSSTWELLPRLMLLLPLFRRLLPGAPPPTPPAKWAPDEWLAFRASARVLPLAASPPAAAAAAEAATTPTEAPFSDARPAVCREEAPPTGAAAGEKTFERNRAPARPSLGGNRRWDSPPVSSSPCAALKSAKVLKGRECRCSGGGGAPTGDAHGASIS